MVYFPQPAAVQMRAADRIEAVYRALPRLQLTVAQVARWLTLPADVTEAALDSLVAAGRLGVTADRRYAARAGSSR